MGESKGERFKRSVNLGKSLEPKRIDQKKKENILSF